METATILVIIALIIIYGIIHARTVSKKNWKFLLLSSIIKGSMNPNWIPWLFKKIEKSEDSTLLKEALSKRILYDVCEKVASNKQADEFKEVDLLFPYLNNSF